MICFCESVLWLSEIDVIVCVVICGLLENCGFGSEFVSSEFDDVLVIEGLFLGLNAVCV